MAEQICPTCGCLIAGEGYETGGVVFCCEPCAKGEPCGCGCCSSAPESTPADEEERHWHIHRP
jgi:hypothetical protein